MNRILKSLIFPAGEYSVEEVLLRVKRLVLAEPFRLYMPNVISLLNGTNPKICNRMLPLTHREPECGTVACVLGWAGLVTGHSANGLTVYVVFGDLYRMSPNLYNDLWNLFFTDSTGVWDNPDPTVVANYVAGEIDRILATYPETKRIMVKSLGAQTR